MQDRPVCFQCNEMIEHSPVYEAPCGHESCRSAVFHGICLMEFRERRSKAVDQFKMIMEMFRRTMQEHTENEGA